MNLAIKGPNLPRFICLLFLFPIGKILVAHPNLDREDKGQYKLAVSAFSSSIPSERVLGEVNIIIIDENDNAPIFSQVKSISVSNS